MLTLNPIFYGLLSHMEFQQLFYS